MDPVRLIPCEPPQAHSLVWLPLAVRFKLDAAGLRVSLFEWQTLTREQRFGLLACPAGACFETLLLALVPQARRLAPSACSYHDYLLDKLPAKRVAS
jgi:hypothetical protein